jgi:hypothetical protein
VVAKLEAHQPVADLKGAADEVVEHARVVGVLVLGRIRIVGAEQLQRRVRMALAQFVVARIEEIDAARKHIEAEDVEVQIRSQLRRRVDDVALVEVEIAVVAIGLEAAGLTQEEVVGGALSFLRRPRRAAGVAAEGVAVRILAETVRRRLAPHADPGVQVRLADQRVVAVLHAHHAADRDQIVESHAGAGDIELKRQWRALPEH